MVVILQNAAPLTVPLYGILEYNISSNWIGKRIDEKIGSGVKVLVYLVLSYIWDTNQSFYLRLLMLLKDANVEGEVLK